MREIELEDCYFYIYPPPGSTINAAARLMIKSRKNFSGFIFNATIVDCGNDDTEDSLLKKYFTEWERKS